MGIKVSVKIEPLTPLHAWAAAAVVALRSSHCRCQMKGGAKWHLQAQREVAIKCSRCMSIDDYEIMYPPGE